MLTIQPYSVKNQSYNYGTMLQKQACPCPKPKNYEMAFTGNPISSLIKHYSNSRKIKELRIQQLEELNNINKNLADEFMQVVKKAYTTVKPPEKGTIKMTPLKNIEYNIVPEIKEYDLKAPVMYKNMPYNVSLIADEKAGQKVISAQVPGYEYSRIDMSFGDYISYYKADDLDDVYYEINRISDLDGAKFFKEVLPKATKVFNEFLAKKGSSAAK